MNHYQDLNEQDKKELLKFPAYISLLASLGEDGIDNKEKKIAVKLTHIKTFSSDPILSDFYKEAERNFEQTITNLNNELPHNKDERQWAIRKELNKLEIILKKLSYTYRNALIHSMRSYKNYVSKAHHHVLEDFIFPMPIKGLTD